MKSPAIKSPTNDLQQHSEILLAVKETVEISQRLRGDPLDSFVRLRELQQLGLVRYANSQIYPADKLLVTGLLGTQTATFSATNKPGNATAGVVAWVPVVTTDGIEGYIAVFGK
jgi:hypothetical protein